MSLESKQIRVLTLGELDFQVDEEFDDMTLTQKSFEILRVGEFTDARYGKFDITEPLLERLKSNFDENVLDIDVAIDLNHDPTQGAFAWIDTLSVQGGKLFMTLKDITSEGRKILKEKVFKYFSVEFAPFETVINGEKATIKDVLRGVALTNRPVIKGMQPTFLSEDSINSLNNDNVMSLIKKLAEDMNARESVSKADATFLRAQFDENKDDVEEGTEAVVAEVEAKAVEAEAKTDEAGDDAPKDPAEADKAEAGDEEKKEEEVETPEAVEASELPTKLAEANQRIATLEATENQRATADKVSSFELSETNTRGFGKKSYEGLTAFVATLSEDQYNSFKTLVSEVVDSSQFAEIGSDESGTKTTEDSKLADAAKLAEVKVKAGMKSDMAMREAQKEVGLGK